MVRDSGGSPNVLCLLTEARAQLIDVVDQHVKIDWNETEAALIFSSALYRVILLNLKGDWQVVTGVNYYIFKMGRLKIDIDGNLLLLVSNNVNVEPNFWFRSRYGWRKKFPRPKSNNQPILWSWQVPIQYWIWCEKYKFEVGCCAETRWRMPVRIDSQIVSKETGPEDAYNNQLLSSKIQRQSDFRNSKRQYYMAGFFRVERG